MELRELGWLCLVGLFLASLLIVLAWLLQYSLTVLRLWRTRKPVRNHQQQQHLCHQRQFGDVWGFLLKLGSDRGGEAGSEVGVKALLTSLLSFKSFREHWHRTWVQALNAQACRHGVSCSFWRTCVAECDALDVCWKSVEVGVWELERPNRFEDGS